MDTEYPSFFNVSYTPCHPDPSTNPPCTSTTFLTPPSAFPDINASSSCLLLSPGPLMESAFVRHPLSNVSRTSHETHAPDFALDQKSNRLHINEGDFSQIEDRASSQP